MTVVLMNKENRRRKEMMMRNKKAIKNREDWQGEMKFTNNIWDSACRTKS